MRAGLVRWVNKHEWLIAILIVTAVLRIPTLFEPYWYGDEGIYLTLGEGIRAGERLYKDIHDNKPPFLYLLAGMAGSLFWFRGIALAWNLATVAVFAGVVKRIWARKAAAVRVAVGVFVFLTATTLFEGNVANAELFFLLPTVAAFGILGKERVSLSRVLAGGILLGLAGGFKTPAILEAAVWPLFWMFEKEKGWLKKSVVLGAAVAIPVVSIAGYFAARGVGGEYLTAVWAQNLPYLSSWKEASSGGGIYSMGGRLFILAGIIGVIYLKRKGTSRWATAGELWVAVTLFSALLSGRPYPHYLLQASGALAVGAGWLVAGKKQERLGVVMAFVLLVGSVLAFRFYRYPQLNYYANFLRWSWGRQTREEYFSWFGGKVNGYYEIAETVRAGSLPKDKIFVWGDEPMIYALARRLPTGRYTAKYHINDYGGKGETLSAIANEKPRYIVVYEPVEELPGLGEILETEYRLETKAGGAEIYRRTGFGL